jgi:signal transduction histidine kinase
LTLAFVAGLAVVLLALSWFVYVRTSNNLLDAVDAGLRSRAEILTAEVHEHGPNLPAVEPTLLESDEAFAQITARSGRVLQSSAIVSSGPLIPPAAIASLVRPAEFDVRVDPIDNVTRVLAVPVDVAAQRYVVLVGASLQDRRDEVIQLGATLGIAGVTLLLLGGAGAWLLVGATLRPVERMRRQAAAISEMGPAARLDATEGTDELGMLARTLNEMLDRVDQAVARERLLIDRASHELRTPLAIQRMDLDLARSGPQTVDELSSALASAAEENDHLTRLADDLLVLSRARDGQLPVHRRPAQVRGLLDEAVRRNEARAVAAGVTLAATGTDGTADVDPDRIRQALDDLIDNSLRVTPPGGRIEVGADADRGRIWVEDSGGGFQEAFLSRAFDPFARDVEGSKDQGGAGLGLAIVRAIARAHGGTARAENIPGGARVTMILADEGEPPRTD